jgi:septum formation protein
MFSLVPPHELVLASSSPRRKELLESLGVSFSIKVSGADEALVAGESADAMVARLALRKAWAVADSLRAAWVIGADTTVAVNGEILGKPESRDESLQMLSKLSGQTHQVVGAFAVVCPARAVEILEVHRTEVTFMPLPESVMHAYADSAEPYDKAGGYAAQGIGAGFISDIRGSYTNVVGLNIAAVSAVLQRLGVIQPTR